MKGMIAAGYFMLVGYIIAKNEDELKDLATDLYRGAVRATVRTVREISDEPYDRALESGESRVQVTAA